ncbi:MAG: Rieske (2Fe-2S) protein [Pseudomonadales bacterium]|jgi:nitrite reductase/ring-hydroxylating ferredoxin subunit|nr:Rieske (2Fe-2S) protein [Pseudomonadales bacterium]MDP6827216.1 Rieske (2Fe-2S) protein [Pseudomonadales bacterium]MDP6972482.1 Rieske (2Fe-2S) protein [Pseudomonadales bacterium]|tara:strand:- start:916 stop:1740 length:825 start_codon:yes stop_codon:yes gene_type:complete
MPDGAVSGPYPGSAIAHVGTYRRVFPVTLERMYENVLDWEHLPYVHASSFTSIRCLDYGAWGWRAEMTNPGGQTLLIELRLDIELRRWITRNLEGPARGAEIWTHAFEIGPERVDINVDFFVPDVPAEARAKVGQAYARAYETLYDGDVPMMVQRARQLNRRIEPLRAGDIVIGRSDELRERLDRGEALIAQHSGREFRIARIDNGWVAFPALCPHLLGPLDAAPIENGKVHCPWHGYEFDLASGECVSGSSCRFIRRPEVCEDGGELILHVPD